MAEILTRRLTSWAKDKTSEPGVVQPVRRSPVDALQYIPRLDTARGGRRRRGISSLEPLDHHVQPAAIEPREPQEGHSDAAAPASPLASAGRLAPVETALRSQRRLLLTADDDGPLGRRVPAARSNPKGGGGA